MAGHELEIDRAFKLLSRRIAERYSLTTRQRQVAARMLAGWSYAKIGSDLRIRPVSARAGVRTVLRKLGLQSRRELGRFLIREVDRDPLALAYMKGDEGGPPTPWSN